MRLKLFIFLLSGWFGLLSGAGAPAAEKKIRIGLSMDTLKEERWVRDKDLIIKRARELGAEVLFQAANSNDQIQVNQAQNLLTQNIDVLIVVPHNATVSAKIVDLAHAQKKKVIAYDRMIRHKELDLYIAFDNFKIGKMEAEYLLKKVPQGNYVLIGGAPTDNNAQILHDGQMSVLRPAIDKKQIQIILDQPARDWQPSEAQKHMENALTSAKNNVAAVLASNDGTAGGAISALKQAGLAGKVPVTGTDADLAACQRIVEGTQAMTVYMPIHLIAARAAEAAVSLAQGKPLADATQKVDNGLAKIPAILLPSVSVDATNMRETVIKDGFQKEEEVYRSRQQK